MRKVVLSIAVSLDGYIADERGGVDWIQGDGSPSDSPDGFPQFLETVDTVLFGYTTYRQIVTELAPGRWDYGAQHSYVFTHHPEVNTPEITFTREDPVAVTERLRREEGKAIWVCGGAKLIARLMEAGLVDRYEFTVVPALLGGGIRLFGGEGGKVPLRFVSAQSHGGMTELVYERREEPAGENAEAEGGKVL